MKKFTLVPLFILACLTFACGSNPSSAPEAAPEVETIVASTLQALTPAAPSAPVYQFENISIAIPAALGTGATPSKTDDVELPFINPSNGPMPQHTVLEISGYPLVRSARIMVFKASEYAAYTELTQKIINTLQTRTYETAQTAPEELTLGPLGPQTQSLSSENGHGLRYVTEILTAVVPVSNDQIFYYYQGVTNDGNYFVSAILPVNASVLVSNEVPFPDTGNAQDFDLYFAAVSKNLSDADPSEFQPALGLLDSLIQSITIQ